MHAIGPSCSQVPSVLFCAPTSLPLPRVFAGIPLQPPNRVPLWGWCRPWRVMVVLSITL
ncbi:hypothetical protein T484DRAFT_1978698 [Baffinella frigidus]|nr:hypothetical protein T484DRAFT_1978698 [Cryptophyta sp. CCMP2293]